MNSISLSFFSLNAPENIRLVAVSEQQDVKTALSGPSAFIVQLPRLPGVSVWINSAQRSSLLIVFRKHDFFAEVIVTHEYSGADEVFGTDSPVDHPTIKRWISRLREKASFIAIAETISAPFAVVRWKAASRSRLSPSERRDLTFELERIASGVAYEKTPAHA